MSWVLIAFGWAINSVATAMAMDVALTYVTDCYQDVGFLPIARISEPLHLLTSYDRIDHRNRYCRCGFCKEWYLDYNYVRGYSVAEQSRHSKLPHREKILLPYSNEKLTCFFAECGSLVLRLSAPSASSAQVGQNDQSQEGC